MRRVLLGLGYQEKSVVRVFNYYTKKYDLKIDNIESVALEEVIRFLDHLSRKGVASVINNLNLYAVGEPSIVKVKPSTDKADEKVEVNVQAEESYNQNLLEESNHKATRDKSCDSKREKQKKVTELNLLAIKRENLSKVTRGIPLPAIQRRQSSKKHNRFLR